MSGVQRAVLDAVRMTYGHGLPERSVAERVLGVLVAGLFVGEAGLLAGRPGFRPVSLFVTRRARYRRVVVCDRLFGLYVAFARHQDVGPGVFQHRNQVGQHVALRVEVFDDLENTCPLPLPAVQFRFEIVSVTLPQGDVASVESRRSAGQGRSARVTSGSGDFVTKRFRLRSALLRNGAGISSSIRFPSENRTISLRLNPAGSNSRIPS